MSCTDILNSYLYLPLIVPTNNLIVIGFAAFVSGVSGRERYDLQRHDG